MRTLIFTGGNHAEKKDAIRFLKNYDFIIAADSGLECVDDFCLLPNYIVGDMDSLQDISLIDKYPNAKISQFPQDKDFTDTELAFQIADDLNSDEVFLFGGGGAMRMDHLVYFLKIFERAIPPKLWVFDTGLGFCFGDGTDVFDLHLTPPKNSVVSVFNICRNNYEKPSIISDGLKWKLDGVNWDSGMQSISNRSNANQVDLHINSGRFLVFTVFF